MLSIEFRRNFEEQYREERWKEEQFAHQNGYFWLPCPICHRFFGGHEDCGTLMISWNRGWNTCKRCAPEAKRRSDKLMKEIWLRREKEQAYRWAG